MNKIKHNFINYIKSKKKKQIVFALFAYSFIILYYIYSKNNDNLLYMLIPLTASNAQNNEAESEQDSQKQQEDRNSSNNAKNVQNAADVAIASGNPYAMAAGGAVKIADKLTGGKVSKTIGKGINQAAKYSYAGKVIQTASNKLSESGASDAIGKAASIKNASTGTTGATATSNSNSDVLKNGSKGPETSSSNNSKIIPNESEGTNENSNEEEKSKNGLKMMLLPGLGCSGIFVLIFLVPLLVLTIISPISSVAGNMSCSEDDEECEMSASQTSLIEKVRNFFDYGIYGDNYKVFTTKTKETADSITRKYDIEVDIPLVLSTLLSDASTKNDEYDEESNTITLNKEILDRINYIEDVAILQISIENITFVCSQENVNDGWCEQEDIDKTMTKEIATIDLEKYYEKLKNNKELLKKIYPEYKNANDAQFDMLIEQIKTNYELFKIMYEIEDESLGNVPSELFYDENVNLQAPLKGNYSVTSPYGNRTGLFAGRHLGIDLVSNDKTIYAAGDGIVTRRNTEGMGGNVIEITHTASNGLKYVTQYAHLSEFLVNKNDTVKAGDPIAIMGCTGSACSGVHLHFQMWNYDTKETYNPANLFDTK